MATDGSDQADPAGDARAAGRPAPPPRSRSTYRTPRYPVFLLTGALVGLLAGLALGTVGSASPAETTAGALGYLAAIGAFFGALLGGTVAVVVESVLNRRRGGRRAGGSAAPR